MQKYAALTTAALAMVTVSVALSAPAAHAQIPFRLSSPQNGQSVRETVYFVMPRSTLGDWASGGVRYIEFSLKRPGDATFLFKQAIGVPAPKTSGLAVRGENVASTNQNVAILWNTKGLDPNPKLSDAERVYNDGSYEVELVAHGAKGDRLGRQVLTLNLNNKGNLQIPSSGLNLAYSFSVGDKTKYQQVTTVNFISEPAPANTGGVNNGGGRSFGSGAGRGGGISRGQGDDGGGFRGGGGPPGGFRGGSSGPPGGFRGGGGPIGGFGGRGGQRGGPSGGGSGYTPPPAPEGPTITLVQNVRANYERTTEDSLGGSTYFVRDRVIDGTIVGGNGSAARLEDVYDFKSRYRTILTSGLVKDNGVASAARPGAYVALPIPNLGGGRRRVGQRWSSLSPILLEWATLDKPPFVTTNNVLENLEWQDGYKTARIKQTYSGTADIPIYGGAGKMKAANVKMERTIWFGYTVGKVVRMETTMDVDGSAPSDVLSAMVPNAGVGGGAGLAGGFPGGGGQGFPGAPGGGGERGFDPGGAGSPGGGFGGLAGAQESPLVPAKFRSITTVQLKKK